MKKSQEAKKPPLPPSPPASSASALASCPPSVVPLLLQPPPLFLYSALLYCRQLSPLCGAIYFYSLRLFSFIPPSCIVASCPPSVVPLLYSLRLFSFIPPSCIVASCPPSVVPLLLQPPPLFLYSALLYCRQLSPLCGASTFIASASFPLFRPPVLSPAVPPLWCLYFYSLRLFSFIPPSCIVASCPPLRCLYFYSLRLFSFIPPSCIVASCPPSVVPLLLQPPPFFNFSV